MDWESESGADGEGVVFVPMGVAFGLELTKYPSELGLGINLQINCRFSPEMYKVSF